MLANFDHIFLLVLIFIIVGGLFSMLRALGREPDENSENKDVEKDQPKSKKFNVPKINLPKFKDSVWVFLYVICGWISLVLMIAFFVEEKSTFAFMMLGFSLSCFFAAHVLRLQEKVAFHAEQQTDHAERQTIHAEKQTELLEKISKPSVQPPPIIEDKE